MKRSSLLIALEVFGFGFLFGFGVILSIAVISSAFSGWEVTFVFNDFGEGIVECILFPAATIAGLIACLIRFRNFIKKG